MSSNKAEMRGGIPGGEAIGLAGLVEYGDGAVVSRTLAKGSAGSLTVFAFDKGQGLSEHSAPFDAYVHILDGEATVTIGGSPVTARTGDIVLMPADVPHALDGSQRFKMLLVMLKQKVV